MKTSNLSVVLLSMLAFALPAAGQEATRQPRPKVVPPPAPPQQSPQPRQPQHRPAAAEFPFNVKLTLEGSLLGAIPTDFSVTTGGSSVTIDLPMELKGDAPAIGSFEAVLTPGDIGTPFEPWQVQVSLGARVALPAGNGHVEYRDLRLSTTVRLAPGKQVVLWEKGEQKLTLSMEIVEE